MDDWQLLRQFVDQNSQEAFAALTTRYLSLVYSVCRREVAAAETAEDVTEAVFLILARKAPVLRRDTVLSGWLFQTARFAAKNARTQGMRRMAYEQKAAEEMEQQPRQEEAFWDEIEPLLNQSLAALKEGERECVLLRFFQEMSFAETGTALGLTEEAARKRLTRAVEKMRRFFGKEGVIVPGVALAALLSAHAAKAVPATCQANIATITHGVLAGHLSLGLTSSHAYQLLEGVLKAMKIIQIKTAVGLAATLVIGFSTYAIAKGAMNSYFMPTRSLAAIPKPGRVLAQFPGKTLTAAQIAGRCREAYGALSAYQGASTVTTQSVSAAFPMVLESHTSANIQFVHPGKIHVEGKDSYGNALAYISDGRETEETYLGLNNWKKMNTTEEAVGGVTGIGLSAPSTIPALLLGIRWGIPLAVGNVPDSEVREDNAEGQPCYVLTTHLKTPTLAETEYLWIDEKTFLIRRSVSERNSLAQTIDVAGKPHFLPSAQTHMDQRFTNEHLNDTISEGTFALPSVQ